MQSELASTPPTITVSKPCGTDDEGNTIYEDVEEPNPQYYALLDQIAAANTGKNGAGVQLTDNEGNSVNPWLLTDTYEAYAYFATDVLSFTLREDGTYA